MCKTNYLFVVVVKSWLSLKLSKGSRENNKPVRQGCCDNCVKLLELVEVERTLNGMNWLKWLKWLDWLNF